ncbi:MAG: PQQ-binding-like beta-propeller repeat protein [Chloroflexota bacterium]
MSAIDVKSAEVKWTFDSGNTNHGQIAVNPYNGLLYFGSLNKKLMVITQDGAFVDSFQTRDSVVSRPVFSSDTVWFSSADGRVFCAPHSLDPGQTQTYDAVSPVVSSPVLVGNTAVFGTDGGQLLAIDTDCSLVWEYGVDGPVDAPLTADENGTVYFAGHSQIGAIDGRSGEAVWVNEMEDAFYFEPTLAQNLVLFVDSRDVIHAYDQANGQLVWSNGDFEFEGWPLVIGDQFLINLANKELALFDFDGQLIKTWPHDAIITLGENELGIENNPMFSPILAGNRIFVINSSGSISELSQP